MEIQKVFSDMYDEEKIYSVLMSEGEVALFSEIQKEFGAEALAAKAAKKVLRENGRQVMAERMLTKAGASKWSKDAVLGSIKNTRILTNPSTMKNGSYAKDMGLSGMDALNHKITTRGRLGSDSWSGVHGTSLGNAKRRVRR